VVNIGNAGELDTEFDAKPRFDSGQEKPEISTALAIWSLENSMFKERLTSKETFD
jgi:hypothetical protein